MNDLGSPGGSVFDDIASLLDVLNERVGRFSYAGFVGNTRGRYAVEVFGTAGNGIDEGCEFLAVLADGFLQG